MDATIRDLGSWLVAGDDLRPVEGRPHVCIVVRSDGSEMRLLGHLIRTGYGDAIVYAEDGHDALLAVRRHYTRIVAAAG